MTRSAIEMREALLQAAARGYCTPENQHKALDSTLLTAVVDEIIRALPALPEHDRDASPGCAVVPDDVMQEVVKLREVVDATMAARDKATDLLRWAAELLKAAYREIPGSYDHPPEAATEWDHNAGYCAHQIDELLRAAPGGKDR